ncbi:MAG: hypothetical protein H0X39_20410 [Actinobacteria bacterium]|nr:hypothetical protein [Actinomycetota bacterium]
MSSNIDLPKKEQGVVMFTHDEPDDLLRKSLAAGPQGFPDEARRHEPLKFARAPGSVEGNRPDMHDRDILDPPKRRAMAVADRKQFRRTPMIH